MEAKTFQSKYDVAEFHTYITNTTDDNCITVVELLLNTNQLDFIEKDFSEIFAIETDTQTYVFSGYEVSEYYAVDDNTVRVVCTK